jgi:predicted Zn-dependent protease
MAGIVAHEIAHIRRRHVTQALVRELGVGALIRTFAGGVGASAEQVVGLSFTRANEAEADADAIATLRRAGIDPRPTAALFASLSKQQGGDGSPGLEFLNSHPGSRQRAGNFRRSFDSTASYRPALDPAMSKALLTACGGAPNTVRQH